MGSSTGSASSPALRVLRDLLEKVIQQVDDHALRCDLADMQRRLKAPLVVAVAGAVSAGKSTLVNALLGVPIAPVAAGEKTRHATWFEYGHDDGRVVVHTRDGRQVEPLRLSAGHAIPEDLGVADADILRVTVTMRQPTLGTITIVDTPGGNTTTSELESRNRAVLFGTDEPPPAQALIYVMPHVNRHNYDLLTEFRALSQVSGLGAANTLAVMSRIDLRSDGSGDPWPGARTRAEKARGQLHGLVLDVVPVAGLLAETGRCRRLNAEHLAVLRALCAADVDEEFLLDDLGAPGVVADLPGTGEVRRDLVCWLHSFGLQVALRLLRQSPGVGLDELHAELVRCSGFDTNNSTDDTDGTNNSGGSDRSGQSGGSGGSLRVQTLTEALRFFRRNADDFKCLSVINQLYTRLPSGLSQADRVRWTALIDTIDTDKTVRRQMRSLRILVALNAVSQGKLQLKPERIDELVRLARGEDPAQQVGLPAHATTHAICERARELANQWRGVAMATLGHTTRRAVGDVLDAFTDLAFGSPDQGQGPQPQRLDLEALLEYLRDGTDRVALCQLRDQLGPAQRLGLTRTATPQEIMDKAGGLSARWRALAASPMPLVARRQLTTAIDAVEKIHFAAQQLTNTPCHRGG